MMILIDRSNTDPYFNIAAEEYVLKHFEEDVLMIWQSTPSVIIGKHQNTLAEVNLDFLDKHHIPYIRRISGGGTVYHDEGNINYTLITTEKRKDRLIDFRRFTKPIIDFLDSLQIKARFEGKNNLTINGKKFSGNSAHVFKNRVMHHGTLLFSTKLDKLNEAIHPGKLNIKDKAVQSIRAEVGNISEFLEKDLSFDQFKAELQKYLIKYYNVLDTYYFSDQDKALISELVEQKYRRWEWNYGYSPSFGFSNSKNGISISVRIKNGCIEKIELTGSEKDVLGFDLGILKGISYRQEKLRSHMMHLGLEDSLINKTLELLGF